MPSVAIFICPKFLNENSALGRPTQTEFLGKSADRLSSAEFRVCVHTAAIGVLGGALGACASHTETYSRQCAVAHRKRKLSAVCHTM